jgi:F-type H+-transporting ATPase subunit gamma
MANLKEIRNRIASVSSTMQITSAMKMVSAAKLKKAQDAITAMRPYANKLTELIQNLSSSLDGEGQNPYTVQRAEQKILIIAITSNRGLCGAFNTNIIKETLRIAKEDYAEKTVEVMGIGKKGGDILSKYYRGSPSGHGCFCQRRVR